MKNVESRSISAENRNGEKSGGGRALPLTDKDGNPTGDARELGQGWKVKPCDFVEPGETLELANISGPGCIQHIWITVGGEGLPILGENRHRILRIYYDDQTQPSVECPIGDFFAAAYSGLKEYRHLSSMAVCVNPGNALNCYWPMPFRKKIRITLENVSPCDTVVVYYQIDYTLQPIPVDAAYFHAQFRRVNPIKFGDVYTILDGIEARGHYVGTYMAWQVNNDGWWGEGEIKFYMDGDADPRLSDGKEVGGSTGFPTICGTGTEDYFCGSYNFENQELKQYQEYTTPYAGVPHIVRPDGLYRSNHRFSMYRWHIPDPIRFKSDLKVTIQALGWIYDKQRRYLPLKDDIASVAYWYQTLPTAPFPAFPDRDELYI